MINEENSLDFVCFALVTVLSRPLLRHKRPFLLWFADAGRGIRAHVESRTDWLFAGKTGLFRLGFAKTD